MVKIDVRHGGQTLNSLKCRRQTLYRSCATARAALSCRAALVGRTFGIPPRSISPDAHIAGSSLAGCIGAGRTILKQRFLFTFDKESRGLPWALDLPSNAKHAKPHMAKRRNYPFIKKRKVRMAHAVNLLLTARADSCWSFPSLVLAPAQQFVLMRQI